MRRRSTGDAGLRPTAPSLAAALAVAFAGAVAAPARAWSPVPPADQGRVVLETFTSKARMPPVQFDHWRHRARHTCRLCHVDVGFAMTAGETRVSAATNQGGFHCGACHDGKATWRGKPIFAACGDRAKGEEEGRCTRCHARGDAEQRRKDFEAFAADLPRRGVGGDVDWEEAELKGLVRPADFVEGVSFARKALRMDKDVAIRSQGWMSDVLFSHKKHAAWNGCEVCHPDIFPNQKGEARRTMLQISSGEACGACHGKVAFGLAECQRCHVKPVR